MDDLQVKAIALNAACVRYAGLPFHPEEDVPFILNMSKEFEKYLKGEKND